MKQTTAWISIAVVASLGALVLSVAALVQSRAACDFVVRWKEPQNSAVKQLPSKQWSPQGL